MAWLPSDFWSDEIEPKMSVQNWGATGNWGDSNLSSPVESAVGLSETDEEDDYMACLAERVAYAMLDDDDDDEICGLKRATVKPTTKDSFMGRSPQSTLSGLENWSSKMNGGFKPSPPFKDDAAAKAWLLLNMKGFETASFEHGGFTQVNPTPEMSGKSYLRAAAVGELRSRYPRNTQRSQGTFVSRKEFQAKETPHLGIENVYYGGFYQAQQPQRAWNPRPKNDEHNILIAKQCLESGNGRQSKVAQAQNRGVNARLINRPNPSYGPGNMGGGSGMRAVFLGSNGPSRESGGTGVFLPRRMDNGYTAKSKPACSTVLLPARIVQALNLNVEDLRSQPCGMSDTANNRREYGKRLDKRQSVGGDSWAEQQNQQHKSGFYPGCYESHHPSSEISLPQEWTY